MPTNEITIILVSTISTVISFTNNQLANCLVMMDDDDDDDMTQ